MRRGVPRSGQGIALCRGGKEGELSGACMARGQSSAFLLLPPPQRWPCPPRRPSHSMGRCLCR